MKISRFCAVTAFAVILHSGSSGPERALADELYDYGEYLSSECTTCHQLSGKDDGIPKITGKPVGSFVRVMRAYTNGKRDHELMRMIVSQLTEDDLHALAVFFEKQGQQE